MIHFINHFNIPKDRKAAYGKIVCELNHKKSKKHQSRLTVGGDKIDYPFDLSTPTADITSFKCLVNLVLSQYEYMFLPYDILPPEIIQQYNLDNKVHSDGKVYIKIRKGMHGLLQAGKMQTTNYKNISQNMGTFKAK